MSYRAFLCGPYSVLSQLYEYDICLYNDDPIEKNIVQVKYKSWGADKA